MYWYFVQQTGCYEASRSAPVVKGLMCLVNETKSHIATLFKRINKIQTHKQVKKNAVSYDKTQQDFRRRIMMAWHIKGESKRRLQS